MRNWRAQPPEPCSQQHRPRATLSYVPGPSRLCITGDQDWGCILKVGGGAAAQQQQEHWGAQFPGTSRGNMKRSLGHHQILKLHLIFKPKQLCQVAQPGFSGSNYHLWMAFLNVRVFWPGDDLKEECEHFPEPGVNLLSFSETQGPHRLQASADMWKRAASTLSAWQTEWMKSVSHLKFMRSIPTSG